MELLAGRSAGRGLSAGGSARRRAFSGSPSAPRASFLLPAPLRAANAPLEPLQPATHTAAVPTRAARGADSQPPGLALAIGPNIPLSLLQSFQRIRRAFLRQIEILLIAHLSGPSPHWTGELAARGTPLPAAAAEAQELRTRIA